MMSSTAMMGTNYPLKSGVNHLPDIGGGGGRTKTATIANKSNDQIDGHSKTTVGNKVKDIRNGETPMDTTSMFGTAATKSKGNTISTATAGVAAVVIPKTTVAVVGHQLLTRRRDPIAVQEFNELIQCYLCKGYLIDATTVIECLHSFCKTCIIAHLDSNTPKSRFCPRCDLQIHKTKPKLNIRSDPTLQDIVYKTVPGLYKNEMTRRKEFYSQESESAIGLSNEEKGEMSGERLIFTPDDHIYLSVEYFPQYISHSLQPFSMNLTNGALNCVKPVDALSGGGPVTPGADTSGSKSTGSDGNAIGGGDDSQRRYLKCEAGMRVLHLKKWLKLKYDLKDHNDIELLYKHDPLLDDYTMIDLAYIYSWRRNGPLCLYYKIMEPPVVKKWKNAGTSSATCTTSASKDDNVFRAPAMVAAKRLHTGKHRHKPAKRRKMIDESNLITTNPVNEPLPPVDTALLKQVDANLDLMSGVVNEALMKTKPNSHQSMSGLAIAAKRSGSGQQSDKQYNNSQHNRQLNNSLVPKSTKKGRDSDSIGNVPTGDTTLATKVPKKRKKKDPNINETNGLKKISKKSNNNMAKNVKKTINKLAKNINQSINNNNMFNNHTISSSMTAANMATIAQQSLSSLEALKTVVNNCSNHLNPNTSHKKVDTISSHLNDNKFFQMMGLKSNTDQNGSKLNTCNHNYNHKNSVYNNSLVSNMTSITPTTMGAATASHTLRPTPITTITPLNTTSKVSCLDTNATKTPKPKPNHKNNSQIISNNNNTNHSSSLVTAINCLINKGMTITPVPALPTNKSGSPLPPLIPGSNAPTNGPKNNMTINLCNKSLTSDQSMSSAVDKTSKVVNKSVAKSLPKSPLLSREFKGQMLPLPAPDVYEFSCPSPTTTTTTCPSPTLAHNSSKSLPKSVPNYHNNSYNDNNNTNSNTNNNNNNNCNNSLVTTSDTTKANNSIDNSNTSINSNSDTTVNNDSTGSIDDNEVEVALNLSTSSKDKANTTDTQTTTTTT